MHVIKARNVNQALSLGLAYLREHGLKSPSRNGMVIRAPGPVTTVYEMPWERVIWSSQRDASPIFHYLESLWMLAGRNDVKFVSHYVPRMAEFSDDGVTLNGAYGYRWRKHFGYDQLQIIIDELKSNPESRRCVLQMWDGGRSETENELYQATHGCKDVCCNTAIYFEVQYNKLNMTVTNRSNDAIWGAYGANAVHMSILQEYIAAHIGCSIGVYNQISNNFHVYTGRPDVDRLFDGETVHLKDWTETDKYRHGTVESDRLIVVPKDFDAELNRFFQLWDEGFFNNDRRCEMVLNSELVQSGFTEPGLLEIAVPMVYAHRKYKEGRIDLAKEIVYKYMIVGGNHIGAANDWAQATLDWFERREAAAAKKVAQ